MSTQPKTRITVGLASCGIAAGAQAVFNTLKDLVEASSAEVTLSPTGCCGMCHHEAIVEVMTPEGKTTYGDVTPETAQTIFRQHIEEGKPVDDKVIGTTATPAPFMAGQTRIVLENCGHINPESIDDYMAAQGYEGLKQVLQAGDPEAVIAEIEASGLKGRGGAGFPTARKWRFTRGAPGERKVLICNADEGDPGAFMDRSVLESDPHRLIEGMTIAAFAIGCTEGYIYCRAEYPLAIKRLTLALAQAREHGLLGEDIAGSGFAFDIHIKEGAGAFVCGEETALIASMEGHRGMPRTRPPYPATKGLWGMPTNINNVETFSNVPWIIRHGGSAFAAYGTDDSPGTKVFALAGKVARGGLVEVPMGMTIREVVERIGGGSLSGRPLKAAQLGGPSGGCVPERLFDTPITYRDINATGAIMGSGGMIVMDEADCMVDIARYFLEFTQAESCGKCTFCRVGSRRMLETLERITAGEGQKGDIETLEHLAASVAAGSLCGLGQTAPNPVLTTIRYFRDEYLEHIDKKRCRAGKCKALLSYRIDPETCVGCTLCRKACPVDAVVGEPKLVHSIDGEKCVKCGRCFDACKFGAVVVE